MPEFFAGTAAGRFEKLNTNQPDAFIDSPFYLLPGIYIRDTLACVHLALSHDYANCLFRREDYRYIRKVIDHTENGAAPLRYVRTYVRTCNVCTCGETTNRENRAENSFRQPGTVQSTFDGVESIMKLRSIFRDKQATDYF